MRQVEPVRTPVAVAANDPRELSEIPEVRTYFRALTDAWPYWWHTIEKVGETCSPWRTGCAPSRRCWPPERGSTPRIGPDDRPREPEVGQTSDRMKGKTLMT